MKKLLFFSLFPFLVFSQTQIGNDIDGQNAGDCSGLSTALSSDGNVLAIGSPCYISSSSGFGFGQVRIFKNISGVWTQIGDDIDGKIPKYGLGVSVSLSSDGSIIAIENYSNDNSSNIQIYENIAGVWTQIGDTIKGGVGFSNSKFLSSDGNTIAVSNSGEVVVYRNLSGVWTQIGNSINASGTLSISSDGNIIAIGIRYASSIDSGRSNVVVYKNISGVWTQIGTDINGLTNGLLADLSISLSSDGSIIAIGDTPSTGNMGSVRIFKNLSGVWTQIGENISGNEFNNNDRFGSPLCLSADGNIIAISARQSDVNGLESGQVRLYKNILGVWTQIGVDINGEAIGDLSGIGLSLSSDGNRVAIGAYGNDGNGNTSGHVRVFDLSGVLSSDSFVSENFKIYPNPVSEILTVELQNSLELQKVIIYNTLGQVIQNETTKTINVSSLTKGSYYAEVITNKGKATKTIIIK